MGEEEAGKSLAMRSWWYRDGCVGVEVRGAPVGAAFNSRGSKPGERAGSSMKKINTCACVAC